MAGAGVALKRTGIALIAGSVAVYAGLDDPEENPAAVLSALVGVAGLYLHFRGRQVAARDAAHAPALRASAPGAHVLYLRSFATDPSSPVKILQSGLSTEEEQLAKVLAPFGELVAIGPPGEPLSLPGARRLYASDSEWQRTVLEQMRGASLVVIRASAGQGLQWEFVQAFAQLRPAQLLILIFRTAATDYAALAASLGADPGVILPALAPLGLASAVVDDRDNPSALRPGFIRFAEGWAAEFLPLPRTVGRLGDDDFVAPFNAVLRPVFDAHGVAWRPLRRLGGDRT